MINNVLRRQPTLVFLAVGAVLGLILGLLIGWVFWPVEWTSASLRDLSTAEKAEYIAAVADAFAIYDSPEATDIAQRRLAPLDDGNLTQAFQEALGYFTQSQFSDRAIRDSNIRRLAVALNLSTGTVAAPEVADNTEAVATSTPPTVATPATTTATNRLGWLGWLLWLLTALLLLGGGIYILNKTGLPDLQTLLKSRTPARDEVDEFETTTPPSTQRGQSNALVMADPEGDYPFEQEADDLSQRAPRARMEAPIDNPYRRPPTRVYEATERADDDDYAGAPLLDPDADEDFFEEDYLEEADEDEHEQNALTETPFDDEDDDGGRGAGRPAQTTYTIDPTKEEGTPPTSASSRFSAPPSKPVDAYTQAQRTTDERKQPPNHNTQPSAALAVRTQAKAAAPTRTHAKTLDQHRFQYQSGIAEYDESQPIFDVESGKYIGEFGMGASSKNALAQVGPDQLVALEVWLFDKSDERNLGNQTRILLSEYAVDHNLEQIFLKERQDNPRPFTPQSGVPFQLESQNLLLNCMIVDVKYSTNGATKGIFQQITVDMTVQKKG